MSNSRSSDNGFAYQNWLVGAAIAVSALICMGSWLFALSDRERIIDEWRARNLMTARVLAGHAHQTLKTVDDVVESIVRVSEASGVANDAAFRREMGTRRIFDLLQNVMEGISQFDDILIAAKNGDAVNHSAAVPPPAINVADRDYFKQSTTSPRPFLGVPARNGADGEWTFDLARPALAKSGDLLGVVIGGVRCAFFNDFFVKTGLSNFQDIIVARADGVVIAAEPNRIEPGSIVAGAIFLDDPDAPGRGVWPDRRLPAADPSAPEPRIISAARVEGFPLVIGVRVHEAKILSDWRAKVTVLAIGAAALSALLVASSLWGRSAIAADRENRRREKEKELLDMKLASYLKAEEEQIRLLDVIAHQARTPLAILKLNLDTLLQKAPPTDATDEPRIGRINRALKRIEDLFDGTLLNSRRVDALAVAERGPLKLRETMERIIGKVRDTLSTHPLTLEFEDLPPSQVVEANETTLEVAIHNLLENAAKFSQPGSPIELRCARTADRVELTVSDRGLGIPDEDAAHLTEKYYRARNAASIPGMGLGLRIVDAIAHAHGGRFVIANREGGGACATISLPIAGSPTTKTRQ